DSPTLAFRDPPLFFRSTARDHVRHLDVFDNAPEIACVLVHHLNFNRLGKHIIKRTGSRSKNQHAAVAGNAWEAVFDFELEILVDVISDYMSAGSAETDQYSVADNKRAFDGRIVVHLRNVNVPSGEILPVEQAARTVCILAFASGNEYAKDEQ